MLTLRERVGGWCGAQARRVRQQEEVREVAELLGVDESGASLLLRSAAWNKEALLSSYMDDAEKVRGGGGRGLGEREWWAHTEVERPLPSNSPHDPMILRANGLGRCARRRVCRARPRRCRR